MSDLKGSLAVSAGTSSALNLDLSSRLGVVALVSELCPRILLTKQFSSHLLD